MAQELHGDMIKVTPEFARRVRDAINLAQALAEGPDIDISVIGTHLKRLQDEIDALRARPVVAPVQSYDDEALRQQLGSELGRVDGRLRLLEESALTPYDDSDLRARVEALEARPLAEPAVDLTSILERLEALESAPRAPEPEVIEKIVEVERVVEVQVEDPRVGELQAELDAERARNKDAGVMVQEIVDQISRKRSTLVDDIKAAVEYRVVGRAGLPHGRAGERAHLTGLLLLEAKGDATMTDAQRARLTVLEAADAWELLVRKHGDELSRQAMLCPPEALDQFDILKGWPE